MYNEFLLMVEKQNLETKPTSFQRGVLAYIDMLGNYEASERINRRWAVSQGLPRIIGEERQVKDIGYKCTLF